MLIVVSILEYFLKLSRLMNTIYLPFGGFFFEVKLFLVNFLPYSFGPFVFGIEK